MNRQKSLEGIFKILYPFLSVILFLLMVAVAFNTFELGLYPAFYNLLLILPLFGLFLMISRRFHLAAIITALIAFGLFYIDQFVYSTRLTHIRFSDIRLVPHAMRVASRYHLIWNFELTRRLMIIIALFAFLLFIYRYYNLRYSRKLAFFTGFGICAIMSAVILLGVIPSEGNEDFNFTEDAEQRGLLYSWYCQVQEGSFEAPEGYSAKTAKAILDKYQEIDGADDVRVIVIMNESLADYSLLGTTHFDDPLPFIHSLDKNFFEGKLAVSVFGGGTANTEFEFLTGNATAFLPEGSTPYLQHVDHEMDSIVSDFGGKSKIAIHPYYSEEWNRAQVYRFFGFDDFISGADFGSAVVTNGKKATSKPSENILSFGDGPLYVRGLISDKTCFDRILEENADFTFAVTMQNHGSYDYTGDDFVNQEYVTEADRMEWVGEHNLNGMLYNINSVSVEEELYKTNQYLTCSNLSDQAFGDLVGELEDSGQKTIVLMFGDHQPGVLISEHYVDCEESVDQDYIVPYFLWANYDVEFDAPEYISPNYLSAVLKKNAGLTLTPWDQFRLEMMEEYPVITANFIFDRNGNQVTGNALRGYEIVQYMRMFE